MKNIILQRVGVSQSLRTQLAQLLTPGAGTEAIPGFYAEIVDYQGAGFKVDIHHGDKYYTLPEQPPRGVCLHSMDSARKELARKATELLGEPVTVDERVEMYTPHTEWQDKNYPHTAKDVEFQRARYEEGTNTIRSVPENYCLIYWDGEGKPHYDCDGATANKFEQERGVDPRCQWRKICAQAHASYMLDVNQRKGQPDAKIWLAWLISEYRKYGVNS